MLKRLLIRSLALIDRAEVELGPGLLVLTGETGAGKSIVVDAMTLILGGKADKELIRQGADKAYAEAAFSLSDAPQAAAFLRAQEIEPENDEIVLSREISLSGRSAARVCGVSVALNVLREVSAHLMDIHGQHEHQSLLDPTRHLQFLDDFGDDAHRSLMKEVRSAYEAASLTRKEYDALSRKAREQSERLEVLRIREKELSGAQLKKGEEDELVRERDRMRNAEKIGSALQSAYESVYEASGRDRAALEGLREAAKAMEPAAAYGEEFETLLARLQSLYYEAEDVGLTLRGLADENAYDEGRMEEIGARLDLLRRLMRKYGASSADMLETLSSIKTEIAEYADIDDRVDAARAAAQKALKAYKDASARLTLSRKTLARKFETLMESQLAALNMAGTRFSVSFKPLRDAPSALGDDVIEFLISPNKGEELKPLSRIASGGELSRLMLAVKSAAAQRAEIPAMVFDEIDTGISGRTAQVVAEKLWDIARYRQVVCVTHLPQLAAMASAQYLVEKGEQDGRTITRLRRLDDAQRADELARMLSGVAAQSESALAHARELLAQARAYREK